MEEASKLIAYLIIAVVLAFIEIYLGTYLWKCIAVAIFGLPALSKLQFFGLQVLLITLYPGKKWDWKIGDND